MSSIQAFGLFLLYFLHCPIKPEPALLNSRKQPCKVDFWRSPDHLVKPEVVEDHDGAAGSSDDADGRLRNLVGAGRVNGFFYGF